MPDIKLTAKIDTTEIDKAIEKAVKLRELLKEANSLARELASGVIMNGDKKTAPHEVASHGVPKEVIPMWRDPLSGWRWLFWFVVGLLVGALILKSILG